MNIIICTSPLQILIAEKIIELHPNEKFCAIILNHLKNEKAEYYFNRLKNKNIPCVLSRSFRYEIGTLYQLKVLFKAVFDIFRTTKTLQFKKVFVASIDSSIAQGIISLLKIPEIYTFDDGTANIVKNSMYHRNVGHLATKKGRIIAKILNLYHNMNTLKMNSKKHYTIYKNMDNIIDKTVFVNLMDISPSATSEGCIKIFLGQPIMGRVDKKNVKITEEIIRLIGDITYYIPHPGEVYRINGIEYINTPLIFEDYFVQNLVDKKVTIYTFFSSAAINVASFPNVKVVSIKPKSITDESYLECYEIFQKMGIEVIDYDG